MLGVQIQLRKIRRVLMLVQNAHRLVMSAFRIVWAYAITKLSYCISFLLTNYKIISPDFTRAILAAIGPIIE